MRSGFRVGRKGASVLGCEGVKRVPTLVRYRSLPPGLLSFTFHSFSSAFSFYFSLSFSVTADVLKICWVSMHSMPIIINTKVIEASKPCPVTDCAVDRLVILIYRECTSS